MIDTLPGGLSARSASAESGQLLRVEDGHLQPGDPFQRRHGYREDRRAAHQPGTLTNTGSVSSGAPDPNTATTGLA